jgi:type IV pilus assembly protein PilC
MAKFKYTAKNKNGETQAGYVEAATRDMAINILTGHELFVLSVEEGDKQKPLSGFLSFLNRVKMSDLAVFTRQFATLMEAKVPLSNSLQALYRQTQNTALKEAIFDISNDVDAGLFLSQAMERRRGVFSEFYISMIRSAEITGRLEEAMVFLADYLEKELMWRTRLRNALIYPAIVIVMFVAVAGIMLVVVFPQIQPIFEETGVPLPIITRIFLNSGSFILNWWWMILGAAILFGFLLIDYFRGDEGKVVLDELKVKIPIFGNLFKKIYVARFAESTSVLIKGGIPITQAIEIAGHSIGNIVYRDILHIMADGVRAGELFSNLLAQNEGYFPILVSQMVAIGEGTGRLDDLLSRISVFYTRDVNDLLGNLVELVQPLLIAGIGILIGLLFASILIPIYNLTKTF